MGRSVVLAGAARCPRCCLPPRWCVCDTLPRVESRLPVHVLIHRGESRKPSSTGRLVARVMAGAKAHDYQRPTRLHAAQGFPFDAVEPGHDLWILHPCGAALPGPDDSRGGPPHLLVLDGTWRQAGEMLRAVEGRGRCVRLPDDAAAAEPSRYWLRDQTSSARLSTAEAVMGVLRAMGDLEAERRLRLHFEMHVYATLLSRGRREMAERYLGHSPLIAEAAEALDRLHAGPSGRVSGLPAREG